MSASNPTSSQCTARSKRTGERCKKWVPGGGVCRIHGGAAPRVKAAQAARALELEAGARVDAERPRQARRPSDVLLASVDASDKVMLRLQQDIAAGVLSPELIMAYGSWVDRAGRLSKLAIDASLDDQDSRAAETAAQMLVACITRILDGLELSADQQMRAQAVVPDVLRSLDAERSQADQAPIEGEVIDDGQARP